MCHPQRLTVLLVALGAAIASTADAQLTRPPTTKPTVIAGPATLTAKGGPATILLTFPGVAGASGFRVTRTNNAGDPETIIFEGGLDKFAFNGAACTVTQGCAYTDAAVSRGYLYSYRIYSLFPNSSGPPIVSPPSPVASAQLKFARLP
ncbi:MAG: hypothetical protein ACKVZ0_09625 [Gemmatimonadales bacterium]